jgi:hypothetical protein
MFDELAAQTRGSFSIDVSDRVILFSPLANPPGPPQVLVGDADSGDDRDSGRLLAMPASASASVLGSSSRPGSANFQGWVTPRDGDEAKGKGGETFAWRKKKKKRTRNKQRDGVEMLSLGGLDAKRESPSSTEEPRSGQEGSGGEDNDPHEMDWQSNIAGTRFNYGFDRRFLCQALALEPMYNHVLYVLCLVWCCVMAMLCVAYGVLFTVKPRDFPATAHLSCVLGFAAGVAVDVLLVKPLLILARSGCRVVDWCWVGSE